MRPAARATVWSAGLTGLLCATVLGAATIGPIDIAVVEVAKALANGIAVPALAGGAGGSTTAGLTLEWVRPFSFPVSDTTAVIVREIRLPRIALAAVVGFALAAAGAVMQGFFRNPMADPSIIGVSSGAAVGAVAAIAVPALVPVDLRLAAFVGALLTAFGVYAIATEDGHTPVATLLLAGVAVQTFFGAVVSYLLVVHSGEQLERAIYWLMGDLHGATWDEVTFALPATVVGTAVLLAYARDLNVLLLGEQEASHLGIEVERTKRVLLALSSLVTAAGVAVAGVIGFVGLIVPHVMRLLVGPDHRVLLPTSALAGAIFLVIADTIARSGAAELPVGIVTAAVGAPFFLFLLRRREVTAL